MKNIVRPQAVLIKPGQGKRLAEVVKETRAKVKPEETETDIRSIRQNRAGYVLIE